VCLELSDERAVEMRHWLLMRCDAEDPDEHRYFLAYGPEFTGIEELVRVCTTCWQIEQCFAEAKGEVGLDHDQVRTWEAWHRHNMLCLLAHAYLVVLRGILWVLRSRASWRAMPEGCGQWPRPTSGINCGAPPPSGRTSPTHSLVEAAKCRCRDCF